MAEPVLYYKEQRLPSQEQSSLLELFENQIHQRIKNDDFVKSPRQPSFVIPVETGIQSFHAVFWVLDTRFRGYDDLLRVHQKWLAAKGAKDTKKEKRF